MGEEILTGVCRRATVAALSGTNEESAVLGVTLTGDSEPDRRNAERIGCAAYQRRVTLGSVIRGATVLLMAPQPLRVTPFVVDDPSAKGLTRP
jgi:hypothetical protein